MAQDIYVIANAPGATVRSKINDHLAATVTLNSGSSAPSTTFADMLWADTSVSPNIIKIRNAGDSAFKTLFSSDGQIRSESGSVALPGHSFASDVNTGASNPSTNVYKISANGQEIVSFSPSGVVFNEDSSSNIDFRVESVNNTHMFFVDASVNRIGINTSSPDSTLHVNTTNNESILTLERTDTSMFASNPIGRIAWRGGETTIASVAEIRAIVAASGWAADDSPTHLTFRTTPASSTTSVERLRIDSSGSVGIGVSPLTNMALGDLVLEGGSLVLKEITTPTADTNYGKVYTKIDNKIYFQDGGGTEHEIAFV